LIHVSDKLTVDSPPGDAEFGLSRPNAVSIHRTASIYQWKEHHRRSERKLNNGETEVKDHYTYSKDWVDAPIDSNSFKESNRHQNTGQMMYRSSTFNAQGVRLGAFFVGQALISQLTATTSIPIRGQVQLPQGGQISGTDTIYFASGSGESEEERSGGRRNTGSVGYQPPKNGGVKSSIQTLDGEERIIYTVEATGEVFTTKQKALAAAAREMDGEGPARRLIP